jgi:hypothetical protein
MKSSADGAKAVRQTKHSEGFFAACFRFCCCRARIPVMPRTQLSDIVNAVDKIYDNTTRDVSLLLQWGESSDCDNKDSKHNAKKVILCNGQQPKLNSRNFFQCLFNNGVTLLMMKV